MIETRTIKFGSYPQSAVDDAGLIAKLAETAGALPTDDNHGGWTSYQYYYEGQKSNLMWYIDVVYDKVKYRGVYIVHHRPDYKGGSSFWKKCTQAEKNLFRENSVYWFCFEPIEWQVLADEASSLLLFCKNALDSQPFFEDKAPDNVRMPGTNAFVNNYYYSYIRKWLNTEFYRTAFSEEEGNRIVVSSIDNGAHTTFPPKHKYKKMQNPYVCQDCKDKVFLLSTEEVTRKEYGFSKDFDSSIPNNRARKVTKYALCQGLLSERLWGTASFLLRSPYYKFSNCCVSCDGVFEGAAHPVNHSTCGVAPAIRIRK